MRTQPNVVGQIPAEVIRIRIDHDFVAVPEPIPAKAQIGRGDAPIEIIEPETVRAPAREMPASPVRDRVWGYILRLLSARLSRRLFLPSGTTREQSKKRL
jgi:hypothetical protein